jgi:hypothetical protein
MVVTPGVDPGGALVLDFALWAFSGATPMTEDARRMAIQSRDM